MNTRFPALVLDMDASCPATGYPGLARIDLTDWQERLRFACTTRDWRTFASQLDSQMPRAHGTVLLGSGDFHHVSALLIARHAHAGLHVLVCDNHPDNMRFPFGIHCGSWVSRVARLPQVARVDVVGIRSPDVGFLHAWENCLELLARGRVRYWTIGANIGWLRALGLSRAARNFEDAASLVAALQQELVTTRGPLYLSIDKDVLDESVARTNWDQGCMKLDELRGIIDAAAPRIVGSDITGEVSVYRYRRVWKRWLSALDGQPRITPEEQQCWQRQQTQVNAVLLEALARAAYSGN